MKKTVVVTVFSILAVLALSPAATADALSTYGDVATIATPNTPPPPAEPYSWQFTSNVQGTGYAGLDLQISGNLTASNLTMLSANYLMTQGTFGGGSPRFTLFDGSNSAWIYWGTPQNGGTFTDPNGGAAWGSTGNLAELLSGDIRVYSNGFGGDNNPNNGVSWATFLASANVGNTQISDITLDVDGGWLNTQQMLVSSMTVNDQVYEASGATPEPSTLIMMGSGIIGLAGVLRRNLHASA